MPAPEPGREILKVLGDVLRAEMDLKADQVTIYNQRWIIPSDTRLYISIKITGSRPYAVNRKYRAGFVTGTPSEVTATLNEELTINTQDIITLNIYSKGEAARIRRNEVILALGSTRCEQEMERYSFSIGQVPVSYVDVSEGEGTAMINRYAITYQMLYAQGLTKPVEYFDQFKLGETVLQP